MYRNGLQIMCLMHCAGSYNHVTTSRSRCHLDANLQIINSVTRKSHSVPFLLKYCTDKYRGNLFHHRFIPYPSLALVGRIGLYAFTPSIEA